MFALDITSPDGATRRFGAIDPAAAALVDGIVTDDTASRLV
jgi:hypothetical protein